MIEIRRGIWSSFLKEYIYPGYTFLFDGKIIAEMHNNLLSDNKFELTVFGVCEKECSVYFKTEDGSTQFIPTDDVLNKACKYLVKKIYKQTIKTSNY